MKTLRYILIFVFFLGGLMAAIAGYYLYQNYQYESEQTVTVFIPRGTSLKKIAALLEENEVIQNRYVFEAYVRGSDIGNIKAGEYEIEKGSRLIDVVDLLKSGKIKLYRFTIPEGYNIYGVCQVLVRHSIMDNDACLSFVKNTDPLTHTERAESLEGYLYPDTYLYDKEMQPEQLILSMVNLFYKKLGQKRIEKAKEMGLSLHELVTFASVVEKETGLASERPVIAGVFHNRLKAGMLLQSDPTTIYGIIENFDGNLTRQHLRTPNKYNTYTQPGLPFGPICNPGLKAIDAVLNPATTEAYYFVSKGDGSHYFSKNLDEHNRAVRYYQLKKGPKPENDLHYDEKE